MKNITFLEQYNKIVKAYMEDKLNPMSGCACFVGNLLNGSREWQLGTERMNKCIIEEAKGFYTSEEIAKLEQEFMFGDERDEGGYWFKTSGEIINEEGLYEAMERTLLMLKKIHERKGEVVENYTFTKRQLKPI